jgi:hypothetical protein
VHPSWRGAGGFDTAIVTPHPSFVILQYITIRYLATIDPPGFQKLLLSVESGEWFSTALQAAYNKKLEDLWKEFLYEINKMS